MRIPDDLPPKAHGLSTRITGHVQAFLSERWVELQQPRIIDPEFPSSDENTHGNAYEIQSRLVEAGGSSIQFSNRKPGICSKSRRFAVSNRALLTFAMAAIFRSIVPILTRRS